jgi:hypothetical protein
MAKSLKQIKKQHKNAIAKWKARQKRYAFCKRHLKTILSLSTNGWPRLYQRNPDYPKWLDLVYKAKEQGIYAMTTSTCDIIANMRNKALELEKQK